MSAFHCSVCGGCVDKYCPPCKCVVERPTRQHMTPDPSPPPFALPVRVHRIGAKSAPVAAQLEDAKGFRLGNGSFLPGDADYIAAAINAYAASPSVGERATPVGEDLCCVTEGAACTREDPCVCCASRSAARTLGWNEAEGWGSAPDAT